MFHTMSNPYFTKMDEKEYFLLSTEHSRIKEKSTFGTSPPFPSLRSPPLSHPLLGEGKTSLGESTKSGIPSWMSAFLKIIIGIVKCIVLLAPLKNIENNNFQKHPRISSFLLVFMTYKLLCLSTKVVISLLLPLFSPKCILYCFKMAVPKTESQSSCSTVEMRETS